MFLKVSALLLASVLALSVTGCRTLGSVPVPIKPDEVKSHLAQLGPSFAARFGKDAVPGLLFLWSDYGGKKMEKESAACIQALKQTGDEGLLYLTRLAAEWMWYWTRHGRSEALLWFGQPHYLSIRVKAWAMMQSNFSHEELSKQFLALLNSESKVLRKGGAILLEEMVGTGSLNSEFTEPVLRLLEDGDPDVRSTAVGLAADLPQNRKIAQAVERAYYRETAPETKAIMVICAGRFGLPKDRLIHLYADAARTNSTEVRRWVIDRLVEVSPRVAIKVWIHLRDLDNEKLRHMVFLSLSDVLKDEDYDALAGSDNPKKWWEERRDYSFRVPGTRIGAHNSVAINLESMKWREPVDFETGEEIGDKEKAKKIREQEDKYASMIIEAFTKNPK